MIEQLRTRDVISGAYVSSSDSYRFAVHIEYAELLRYAVALEKEERRRISSSGDPYAAIGWIIADDLIRARAGIIQVMACMSLEGALNTYGVLCLGEDFYARNIERLGPTEKLSLLLGLCDGLKISPEDGMLADVRSLFNRRNQLVHPKTRVVKNYPRPREPGERDMLEATRNVIVNMEKVFRRIGAQGERLRTHFGEAPSLDDNYLDYAQRLATRAAKDLKRPELARLPIAVTMTELGVPDGHPRER